MTEQEQALIAHVDRLRDKLIDWTRQLVAIPTVNPYSGDSSAGSEAPGQDWIEARLRELGADTRRVPVPADVYEQGGLIGPAGRSWDGRENVVAEWVVGDGQGPTIVLNDHMDTVGAEGMAHDPFDPVIRDGVMYGRGTTDTKGNLVVGLMAVEALLANAEGAAGRIVFESVVDEECNGGGAGTLACCLAGVTGDVAICLDGSGGVVRNGCNGIATARVVVLGQAGHSSGGGSVNAIDKGIAAKQAIDAFGAELNAAHPDCRANVGIFRSGTLPAIVPGEAELQLNISYPAEEAARAERELGRWTGELFRQRFEQAMADLADADPWFADKPAAVSWIKDLYPFDCPADDPVVQLAAATAAEVRAEPVPIKPLPAWLDAAHLSRQLGVPTVGLGAGDGTCAHASTEFVKIDELAVGARILTVFLSRLLKRKG